MKCRSYRLASRVVNTLGAGEPVHSYEDLHRASLVIVNVPEDDVDTVIADLARLELSWKGKAVALYESARDATILAPLAAQGAAVCTFNVIAGREGQEFLLEGDPEGLRTLRSTLLQRSTQAVEIMHGRKREYLDAAYLASDVFPSLVAAVAEGFRRAGLAKNQAEPMAETMLTGAMKAYFRGGRRAVRVDLDWSRWMTEPAAELSSPESKNGQSA